MAEPRYPVNPPPLAPGLRPFRQCVACGIYLSRERSEPYCAVRFCVEVARELGLVPATPPAAPEEA